MGVRGDSQLWLNVDQINHPVVRGPILQLGVPARQFGVTSVLDQEVGAVRGVSSIVQRYDFLPAMGQYRSGEIANRMLTRQWQCAHMGFPNHYRRTLVLYELPRTNPGLPQAYVRSILDLLSIPHYYALSVLDRDEDWRLYAGSYPNFYSSVQVRPSYGETDPAVVWERSVRPLVDHLNEDGELELGRISLLPRRMTQAYLRMYEAAKQEILDLEEELRGTPPPTAVRRQWILNRLARLRQIQNLDLKIDQLQRDMETLDRREDLMRQFVAGLMAGEGGDD
jgi:hypothetical protein